MIGSIWGFEQNGTGYMTAKTPHPQFIIILCVDAEFQQAEPHESQKEEGLQ